VANNVLSVTKAATSSGMTSAMNKGAHAGFASTLSAQDLLNLSAYINSAK
jgi:hypothetical protein